MYVSNYMNILDILNGYSCYYPENEIKLYLHQIGFVNSYVKDRLYFYVN